MTNMTRLRTFTWAAAGRVPDTQDPVYCLMGELGEGNETGGCVCRLLFTHVQVIVLSDCEILSRLVTAPEGLAEALDDRTVRGGDGGGRVGLLCFCSDNGYFEVYTYFDVERQDRFGCFVELQIGDDNTTQLANAKRCISLRCR